MQRQAAQPRERETDAKVVIKYRTVRKRPATETPPTYPALSHPVEVLLEAAEALAVLVEVVSRPLLGTGRTEVDTGVDLAQPLQEHSFTSVM